MITQPSIQDLRAKFKAFSDLSDSQLNWLLQRCEPIHRQPGEYIAQSGDPANSMFFTVEGTFHARATNSENPVLIMTSGMISGCLPFSRMTHFPLSIRAHTEVHILALHKQHFPALYQEVPELIPKLVSILTDRVRETTRATTQTDKLAAIGKLAAGLAHELNNPAAAARQASSSAKQIFDCYRETLDQLAACCASKVIHDEVRALEASASAAVHTPQPIDSLTRSDLEESLLTWLESIGIEDAWRTAPAFVSAGFNAESLAKATANWPTEVRELALFRIAAAIEMEQVLAQMSHATTRISDLVTAMKDYSFMDRAAAVEIDINQSIQSTLTLFSFRFKSSIQLNTTFAPYLPKLTGHGGQLNQVWTNLIDNALDAMEMQKDRTSPGQLTITTSLELDDILIEFSDNGPGIPADVAAKVFDPFFTTKPQGEGTGLGLDTVYRIIRQHKGGITFHSEPGKTTFSVRLPIRQPS